VLLLAFGFAPGGVAPVDKAGVPQVGVGRCGGMQKHHPDKNEDKERAKIIFTEIT
jgi:hypothetical protein